MTWTGIIVGECDTLKPATGKRKISCRPTRNQREISAKKPPNRARKLLFISNFIVLYFLCFSFALRLILLTTRWEKSGK